MHSDAGGVKLSPIVVSVRGVTLLAISCDVEELSKSIVVLPTLGLT
jgi:hypothetical protein